MVKLDKVARGEPFVGAEALQAIKAAGLPRRLVGLKIRGRGIARHGAEVLDAAGAVVGAVTSGGVAPTVGGSIALAYVPAAMSEPGAVVNLRQRGQDLEAEVVKGPFYKRPAAAT